MKFYGKICFKIILKATKKTGIHPLYRRYIFQRTTGGVSLVEYADFGTHWIALYVLRIQANNSIMCRYFYTGFIDFMIAGKTLIDHTSLFSPYDFEKHDNIIHSYFKNE